jgi:hypothetical protein
MSQPRMDGVSACHALAAAFEQLSTFTADYPCGDTPGLCASREDTGAMLKNGKAPPALAGGAHSLRGLRYPRMATTPA